MRETTTQSTSQRRTRSRQWLAIAVFMAIVTAYFFNLGGWLVNDDEGTALYAAWRVSEGDVPHQDFESEHSPFFPYLGAGVIKLFGASAVALRGSAAILTLLGTYLLFQVTRPIWGLRAALLGVLFYALNLEVFFQGRVFRTDSYMLFFVTGALCALIVSRARNQRWWLVVSAALFSVATLLKVIGALPAFGGGLVLLYGLWLGRRTWRPPLIDLLLFGATYVTLLGAGYGLFLLVTPELFANLAGAQGTLGEGITFLELVQKGIAFLALYFRYNLTLLLAIPAVVIIWRRRDPAGLVLVWQLPTALVVLAMRGPQFPRYFLYLAPTWALLLAYTVEMFIRWCESVAGDGLDLPLVQRAVYLVYRAYRRRGLEWMFAGLIALFVLSPWLRPILAVSAAKESDTLALAHTIARQTEPEEHVLVDYASLNFHSQRPGVYQTDIISWGHAAAGILKGVDLIEEIEAKNVKLIAIHVGGDWPPQHFVAMPDYDEFYRYVQDHFQMIDTFDRVGQLFEIYLASDDQSWAR